MRARRSARCHCGAGGRGTRDGSPSLRNEGIPIAAVVTDRLAGLAARADALADAVDPTAAFLAFIRELTAEAKQNVALDRRPGRGRHRRRER